MDLSLQLITINKRSTDIIPMFCLIILVLTIIELFISLFISSHLNKHHNVTKTQENKKEKEENEQIKHYNFFNTLTTIVAIIVSTILLMVFFYWLSTIKNSIVYRIAPIFSFLYYLSIIYINSNQYDDFLLIKSIFLDDLGRSITIMDLTKTISIISLLYIFLYSPISSLTNRLSVGSCVYQIVIIIQTMLSILVLLLLIFVIVIEIVVLFKRHKIHEKILLFRKKYKKANIKGIPSRKFIYNNRKWKPSKILLLKFFIYDTVYKIISTPLIQFDLFFMVINKSIVGLLKNAGCMLGISVKMNGVIGIAKTFIVLVGCAFVLSMTITYTIILFSNEYTNSIKELYSFITGIVVIPAIIGLSLRNNK